MKNVMLAVFVTLMAATAMHAQTAAIRKKAFNLGGAGLAIQGYDPVAYFTEHKAIEGTKDFRANYNGVTYRFSSQNNQNLFKANPAKFEPQYGGWCAYAMGANGEKVAIDPETFKVLDGKLYLFYNKFFNNTLPKWNEDELHLKSNADRIWPKFIQ